MRKLLDISYTPLMDYGEAWDLQKRLIRQIDAGENNESLLLLQHPATYTVGVQNHPENLLLSKDELQERGISVFEIDRGGDITYHGPGQLVGYPLLLLNGREGLNLHGYLRDLEQVVIDFLAQYDVQGTRKPAYTGVWVGEHKICAIGVKFNRCRYSRGFVTSHGFAFNIKAGIQNDGFQGIVPCGIQEFGITTLEDCTKRTFNMEQVAEEIIPLFTRLFNYEGIRLDNMKEAR
ncbi:lipoyl(octanoyl) transferase LipB [Paenibacillus sp. CMAA1364]